MGLTSWKFRKQIDNRQIEGSYISMIKYKIDVIKALKEKGYTVTQIRRDGLLSGKTLTAVKEGGNITIDTLNRLCSMLRY